MSKDKKKSIEKLKEQYIQAHLSGNSKLKKMYESMLIKLGEKVPKV
jgi:hypothetical protein